MSLLKMKWVEMRKKKNYEEFLINFYLHLFKRVGRRHLYQRHCNCVNNSDFCWRHLKTASWEVWVSESEKICQRISKWLSAEVILTTSTDTIRKRRKEQFEFGAKKFTSKFLNDSLSMSSKHISRSLTSLDVNINDVERGGLYRHGLNDVGRVANG